MYDLIVDTCVWIKMCSDVREWPLLDGLEKLVAAGKVRLIVPTVIRDEAGKHLPNTAAKVVKTGKSWLQELRFLGETVITDPPRLSALDETIAHFRTTLDAIPPEINKTSDKALALIQSAHIIEPSSEIDTGAIRRGIEKKAPFNSGSKNSMADAVILETILAHARSLRKIDDKRSIAFVTDNKSDFSAKKDHRVPHDDFAGELKDLDIKYYINIAELLEILAKEFDSEAEQKKLTGIIKERKLVARVADVDILQPLTSICQKCGGITYGGYRHSYAGLSWHLNCGTCGMSWDTGECFD
ncbi:MAG: PIN domain-containing protein [Pseudomonadota bacterium]